MGRTTEMAESGLISSRLDNAGCMKTEAEIRSAIKHAVESKNYQKARLGLDLLENPEHTMKQINTMMLYSLDNCENLKFLLDLGANPNMQSPRYFDGVESEKPLHQAISRHKLELVKVLVQNNASTENVSSHSDSPIDALAFAKMQLNKETCYGPEDPGLRMEESQKIILYLEAIQDPLNSERRN